MIFNTYGVCKSLCSNFFINTTGKILDLFLTQLIIFAIFNIIIGLDYFKESVVNN